MTEVRVSLISLRLEDTKVNVPVMSNPDAVKTTLSLSVCLQFPVEATFYTQNIDM